jgi:hypothetical protein
MKRAIVLLAFTAVMAVLGCSKHSNNNPMAPKPPADTVSVRIAHPGS